MSITPSQTQPPRKRRQPVDRLTLGLLIAFGIMAIITAIFAFSLVRNLVSSWEMTKLPGAPQTSASTTEELLKLAESGDLPLDQPLQPAEGPEATPWDGASRVTILVMGLDYRDWEAGETPRTDTMMLLTIDPLTKTAGMLSIPRDMWVTIPGFDHAKINTAYYLGEVYNLPGGGPALAVQTVEEFLGVHIDYYAQVDFAAFVRFIDEIDGLDLIVREEIVVDPVGPGNTVTLHEGMQNLDGATTLGYARARYTDGGDFDRARRQQEVVLAVIEQVTTFNMLPTLVAKAPKLYNEISGGIRTNMNLTEAIQLAKLGISINQKAIKHRIITPDVVTQDVSPDGLSILVPIPDEIRMIRDDVFSTGGSASPIATIQGTKEVSNPAQLAQAEQARISIQNGTQNPGLAQTTSDFFRSQGLNIIEETNADQIYNTTTIIIYNGKPYTIKYLSELMEVPVSHIYNRYDPNAYVDVVVILSTKWAESNPMTQ